MPAAKNDDKNSRVQVIIAVIGLVGVISAALIASIDKWWPKAGNNQNDSSSNTNKSSRIPEPKNDNSALDPKPRISKTVALMDNNLLTYDKNRGRTGRTNQAEIEDALKGMELRFIQIDTNLNWNDYAKLTDPQPDLIIVHVSAFYDRTDPNDKGYKFRTFLENAMPSLPKTKLLVYSRAFQEVTTSDVERYASAVPHLRERIRFFLVKAGPKREYFNDMETAGKLRSLVTTILASP